MQLFFKVTSSFAITNSILNHYLLKHTKNPVIPVTLSISYILVFNIILCLHVGYLILALLRNYIGKKFLLQTAEQYLSCNTIAYDQELGISLCFKLGPHLFLAGISFPTGL